MGSVGPADTAAGGARGGLGGGRGGGGGEGVAPSTVNVTKVFPPTSFNGT